MERRVVVTGLGVISPIGTGKDKFWHNLIQGKSGIDIIKSFDTTGHRTHRGAEVKDFNPEDYLDKEKITRFGEASVFAICATKMAIEDAKLNLTSLDKERIGIGLGTTSGEIQVFENILETCLNNSFDSLNKEQFLKQPSCTISANVAIEFGFAGPNTIITTACSAGNYAIGFGFDKIRNGQADIMITGGVDVFSKMGFVGFNRMLAVDPEDCRPFSKNRKGLVVGEGCATLILEELKHALLRKKDIYAEVLGYGLSCDAFHITRPHPKGTSQAILNCLKKTKLKTGDIDYISAHGTGTSVNDHIETIAIKKVFNQRARQIPISSIKSMVGHAMGAASSFEAVSCCLAIKHAIIPPTINFEQPDPDCDLDYVPNNSRKLNIKVAISNSFAFGGNNACVALAKL